MGCKQRVLLFALLASLVGPGACFAEHFTTQELAALRQRVVEYESALATKDYKLIVEVVPPKFIAAMALNAKLEESKLRAEVLKTIEDTMNKVEIVSYSMEENDLNFKRLSDGSDYVLIPTEVVMRIEDKTVKSVSQTLAILDGGKWYLVRTGEAPQRMMLSKIYPAFQNVDFPDQQMMEVE